MTSFNNQAAHSWLSLRAALVFQLAVIACATHADVTLPRIFGDNMVLQRNKPVPVWGKATPGERVTVAFAGQKKSVTAGANGSWKTILDPLPANKKPQSFVVSGQNKVTLENVLVGEVWLCSGQSNMEWEVDKSANAVDEKATANFPEIRHFKVPRTASAFSKADTKADWRVCSPETVGGFTAVGYFYARELFRALDVPIGLLNSTWGGTAIELWLSPESVASSPDLTDLHKKLLSRSSLSAEGKKLHTAYLAELKKWTFEAEAALARDESLTEPPAAPWMSADQPQATQLYKGMIHPLVPFALQGAIWYQGESNGAEPSPVYLGKLKALIGGWRTQWNQGDFPFYIVQLSNFGPNGSSWTGVREAQLQALSIPNTGLAVTTDIGNSKDIHPPNKQDVGKRLARWALARSYGSGIYPSGPLYKNHRVESAGLRVSFDHAPNGLMIGKKDGLAPVSPDPASKLRWIEIAGEDRVFKPADAVIEGSDLILSSPEVPAPVAVRYAYCQDPAGANLYNTDGLPASPFRSDSWQENRHP
jgi:sialate O-acetylesterase